LAEIAAELVGLLTAFRICLTFTELRDQVRQGADFLTVGNGPHCFTKNKHIINVKSMSV
jgi:hypothetical protein